MTLYNIFKKNKLLILIFILVILLRILFLSNTPALVDESYRLYWGETNEGLREMLLVDSHPAFLYKFINSLYHILADSVLLTRLFFLLCGLINVFLIYKLAKKFNSEKVAIFISAINLFFILYSIHISPYIILSTLTLLSTLILMKLNQENKILNLSLLGIIWGFGINVHYYFFLLIATHILILFYLLKRKQKLYLLLPICIAFLLFLPALDLFIFQLKKAPSLPYLKTDFIKIIWTMTLFYLPHAFSISFILSNKIAMFVSFLLYPIYTILLIKFLISLKRFNKNTIILLVSFFGFIFLNIIGASAQIMKFHARYLSIILPLYLIMVSTGLSQIKNPKLKKFIMILLFIISLINIWLASTVFPFRNNEVLL